MNRPTDQQLLQDYAEHRQEAAFTELVQRHVNLVYSTALRMLRDAQLAEDVTQGVFAALAQNAPQLKDHPVLSGWLHHTARNVATKRIRTDARRRAREQEAVAMNELLITGSDASWEEIAPQLDDALEELNAADRDALLLRYFEHKSAREMGQLLGVSDEAAQKRVNRAVERLRELFARRGVTVGASGLVVVISANAVQAAPVGLTVTISTAATLAGTTIATHTTMNWITAKTVGAIVIAALTAGTGTYLVQQRESNRLRIENQNLAAANLATGNERDTALSTSAADHDELEHLRKEKIELLRLRGEVGVLRQQASGLAGLKEENLQLRKASSLHNKPAIQAPATAQADFPKESWAFAGYATPETALQSWTWAMSKGDKQVMLASLTPDARKEWEKLLSDQSDSQSVADGAKGAGKISGYQIVDRAARSDSEVELTISTVATNGQSNRMKMTVRRIENEWKIVGPSEDR